MSKRDEKIEKYREFVIKHKLELDDELLVKVVVGLGPSIYNKNAELIACSSAEELDRIRDNFLKKKLGLKLSDEELDIAIKEVCKEIGSSVRNKIRSVFYTLLVIKLKQESFYK